MCIRDSNYIVDRNHLEDAMIIMAPCTCFTSGLFTEKYAARYPELTIKQPPYTLIEFDDSMADDAIV